MLTKLQYTVLTVLLLFSGIYFFLKFFENYKIVQINKIAPEKLKGEEVKPRSNETATSGKLFKGERIAVYKEPLMFKEEIIEKHEYKVDSMHCDHWSVVTTIFPPTDAIQNQALINGWCLVIVGDKKGPKDFSIRTPLNNTVFLDVEKQEELQKHFKMLNYLKWNHFGRKNVGYMYAILHGAKTVWDFDDDNYLHLDTLLTDLKHISSQPMLVNEPLNHKSIVLNPYPLMGTPHLPSWPRGYPLDKIKANTSSYEHVAIHSRNISFDSIGIIQSLANHDPDVDAIYRLTQLLPVEFKKTSLPLLIPYKSYSPYNAQATLHNYNALWSLLLPVTIHGRVTDIWRGYATIRLFQDIQQQLVFYPPLVTHIRNEHTYLADFESETPLYLSSLRLVEQLTEWTSTTNNLAGRIEELWIFLYEHGYIGLNDVELVKGWLSFLYAAGYKFPKISNTNNK